MCLHIHTLLLFLETHSLIFPLPERLDKQPKGTGELQGVGERLAWLIWLCKTKRHLLSALGGLLLCVMSCATVQPYQSRLRSSDSLLTCLPHGIITAACQEYAKFP